MTGSINSLQRQGITGNAMIECLGEIWYHGSCDHGSTHDSNANSPTTLQYGQETLSGYNKALQANGATPCPTATPGGGTSTPTAGNGQSDQLMSNYINPDPGCTITSGYGPRIDPWGANEYHPGVDCSTGRNSPILSANGGKVIAVETGCPPNLTGANDHCGQGYGNYVVVAQPNGYQIMYSHLGQVNVQLGQTVTQSQQLGLEGTSGRSTGNHLLFEVDKVNPGVDPYTPWLKPGQYQTVNPSSLGIPLGR
jgi:murein DD-endopeptidase MepM/ murein hydrolase activator NlpD